MKQRKLSYLSLVLVVVFSMTLAMSGLVLAQANESAGGWTQSPIPKITDIGQEPASAIFIGNSFFYFNNGITRHVSQLVAKGRPQHKFGAALVTIAGSGLNWHDVNSYFRPDAIGSYSTSNDGKNLVTFKNPKQLFEVAIMMDNSQGPIHPQLKNLFTEYAKKDSEIVRQHGAKPVFFMTWAYADKPEMTQQLADAYTQAGNENDALVIPAGLAFARSIAQRPDINLYLDDHRHPTLEGTYLAAATVYAALFKKSPVGLTYNAGLDDAVARHLQEAAWDTVQEYYKW